MSQLDLRHDPIAPVLTLDLAGVEWAASVIDLPETPSWTYPRLDAATGASVVVKHENVQPIGAFKVRGGLALVAALGADELAAGLITASTGNHAQSVAYGARRAGVRCTVVVPQTAPAGKIAAVQALGAEVVVHGPTMTEAAARAVELAAERGMRFVHPGDEPAIVLGHATVYLELLRRHPDLEAVYVPVGGGSGAAGACLVRDALAPSCRVVAVQSAQAPAACLSWRAGELRTAECTTRMSGLATGAGFALPQSVLRGRLDDFRLVDDDAIDEAAALLAATTPVVAEGAGAAALAGLLDDPGRPERCAVVVTGGNATPAELARLASRLAEPVGPVG